MSRSTLRATFVAAVALALAGTTAAPAAAARPAKRAVAKKAVRAPKPRPVRYVVVGTLSAVDAATITLDPTTGGNALTAPAAVTLTVAAGATVLRDDVRVTLAELVAGDHVAASGTRTGTAVTITKVIATSPEPVVEEPVVTDPAAEPAAEEPAA